MGATRRWADGEVSVDLDEVVVCDGELDVATYQWQGTVRVETRCKRCGYLVDSPNMPNGKTVYQALTEYVRSL